MGNNTDNLELDELNLDEKSKVYEKSKEYTENLSNIEDTCDKTVNKEVKIQLSETNTEIPTKFYEPEYRSYLKIGKIGDEIINPMADFRDRYEIIYSEYSFSQEVNKNGEAQSDVSGGIINIAIPKVPTDKLLNWMLDGSKFEDGEIVLYNILEEIIEQVYFEEARCIGFRLHYEPFGPANVITQLTINAQKIEFGDINYKNPWKKN